MKRFLRLALVALLGVLAPFSAKAASPDYTIQAIRYSSVEYNVAGMVMGAPKEKITIAMVVWLIRGGAATSSLTAAFTTILSSNLFHRRTTFVPTKR